jgi:hypothetical protein
MASVSGISVELAAPLVQLAGGVLKVAEALGVPEELVQRWCKEGVGDAGHAEALTKLAQAGLLKRGRPRRTAVMSPEAVAEAVRRHGGFRPTSRAFQIPASSLRRYVHGSSTPTEAVASLLRGDT